MNDADFGKTAQQFHRKHNAPVRDAYDPKKRTPEEEKKLEAQRASEKKFTFKGKEYPDKSKDATPAKIEKEVSVEDGPRCTYCGKKFESYTGLQVHYKNCPDAPKAKESKDVNPETLGTELKEFFKEEAEEPEHAATDAELIPIDDEWSPEAREAALKARAASSSNNDPYEEHNKKAIRNSNEKFKSKIAEQNAHYAQVAKERKAKEAATT